MKKKWIAAAAVAVMSTAMAMTSYAAGWQKDATGWWWQNDDGSYPAAKWEWLDGNHDGTAESYYFDASGYLLTGTTTPDGYTVNADGAWVENGVVQTQAAAQTASQPVQDTNTNPYCKNVYEHGLYPNPFISAGDAKDYGDYYELDANIYESVLDFEIQPEDGEDYQYVSEKIRIRKDAVVHWYYGDPDATEDITLDEYANRRMGSTTGEPFTFALLWKIVQDENGYIISFEDTNAG